jgi:signal transduction histidine kinase/ligand-binding sensor domain-containing protein/DNA-binding response OmpR family regulator
MSRITIRHSFFSLLLLLIFGSFNLKAQTLNPVFKRISVEQGLSQANVTCILQDNLGFMWIGTRDGLNRYDGYSFRIYKGVADDPTTISNNFIQSIVQDKNGVLWIGTMGGGLSMYDRDKDRFVNYMHNDKNKYSISNDNANVVFEDSRGQLWVGTASGLNLFDRARKQFVHYFKNDKDPGSISHDHVLDIKEDADHNLWMATMFGGINKYNPATKKFTRYEDDGKPGSIGFPTVHKLLIDSKQRLWLATRGGGLIQFDKATQTFKTFKNQPGAAINLGSDHVLSIAEDEGGTIWLGLENGGIALFDGISKFSIIKKDDFDETTISSNSCHYIYKDRNQNMWLGMYAGGVNLYTKSGSRFTHFKRTSAPTSLSNNNVLCLFEDSKDNLWVGTDGGGLNLMNRTNGTFTHFTNTSSNKKSIRGNYILSVAEDANGNIWAGTWGTGISVLTKQGVLVKHFDKSTNGAIASDNVWIIKKDSRDRMWIGTFGGGLDVYDLKTGTFRHYRPDDNAGSVSVNVSAFLEDKDGDMWVGTFNGGLYKYDPVHDNFIKYVHSDAKGSISNNTIASLFQDRSGNIWVGTYLGLNLLDKKQNSFTAYNIKHGLPGEMIFGVEQDSNGQLWMSTNNGVSRFNPATKTFRNYTVEDGLQGKEFKAHAVCKTKDGAIYFGGINGFNKFYPEKIKDETNSYPIYLTNFLIFNKPVAISSPGNFTPLNETITYTKKIFLSHTHSVVSFEFASLNFSNQQTVQYAYKLEGFDKDWVIGKKREATYTNLEAGDYVFKVKTLDGGNKWSEQTASLEITVFAPFYKTWLFYGIILCVIGAILVGIYQMRVLEMKKQQLALERLVRERTSDLEASTVKERASREEAEKARLEAEHASKAKSVFLATMSHEIRTPMNGVIGTTSLLAETPLDDEQKRYVDIIKSSGENLLSVINDILDFSKIESEKLELERVPFDLRSSVEEVLDLFAGKAAHVGLDLIYQIEYNVPTQIYGDPVRLKQILLNLTGNAIKFTHKGEIFIGVKLLGMKEGNVEIGFEVRDTGIGIPKDKLGTLFQAFTQVDSSTTRKYGGTGLGLAISKRLTELMGGQIHIESELGKGTSFHFSIVTQPCKESVRSYVYTNVAALENKRILIVDDNETNLKILNDQLENWKFVCVTAQSAEDAIGILQDHNFDMVISDMQMPDMDGAQLATHIKKAHADLPIILLSSLGDNRSKHNEHLFCSVLAKPIKQKELHKAIIVGFKQGHTQLQEKEIAPVQKMTTDFAAKYPLNILIAEDNPVNQTLISMVMKKLGYQPLIAVNGLKAVEALNEKQYDIVLMDVQMPEMDGLEATQLIRAQLHYQPIIIAVTANAMQDDKEACLQAGMDDYISKPIQLDKLVSILEKWGTKIISSHIA